MSLNANIYHEYVFIDIVVWEFWHVYITGYFQI